MEDNKNIIAPEETSAAPEAVEEESLHIARKTGSEKIFPFQIVRSRFGCTDSAFCVLVYRAVVRKNIRRK